jgi:hypothetical protein
MPFGPSVGVLTRREQDSTGRFRVSQESGNPFVALQMEGWTVGREFARLNGAGHSRGAREADLDA